MKKLLLLLLVVPFLISAQWSFSEKNDPFDGNVKTVIAQGYGGDFPYQNPSLVFRIEGNKRENPASQGTQPHPTLSYQDTGRISFSKRAKILW